MRQKPGRRRSGEMALRGLTARERGPIPIWQSRLYQERRVKEIASRMTRDRLRRIEDGTLLREKRALAAHLLDLCDRAECVLHRRGGNIVDDLQRVDDLGLIVMSLNAEPGARTDPESIEESRNYLEAMVLAIEVARVAGELGRGVRTAGA